MSTAEFPKSGFVRKPAVCAFVGCGPTKLHSLVKSGDFPQPVRLSERMTVYRAEEVVRWVDEKTAQRDATKGAT